MQDIKSIGGSALIDIYGGSLFKLLSAIYTDYEWLPWRFSQQNYFENLENQKKFLCWVELQLKISEKKDWYNVKGKVYHIYKNKILMYQEVKVMGSLLTKYNNSLYSLLCAVYPEYEWIPWLFYKTPQRYWNNIENQLKFIEWASKQYNIKLLSDWYNITANVPI